MGNLQSVEAPRRPQNKLSKPRTNNSTPNLLGSSSNLLSSARPSQLDLKTVSKRPSFISTKGTITTDGAGEAPPAPKEKPPRRLGLFRSKSANAAPVSAPLPDPLDPEQRMPNLEDQEFLDPLRRYSQRISVNYDVLAEGQYPLHDTRLPPVPRRPAPELPFSRQNSRRSLAIEAKSVKSQEAEGTNQEQVSRRSSVTDNRKSIIASPPLHPPPEPSRSPATVDIPIRRRSLQTPGVATRQSWAKETMRTPFSPQQDVVSFSRNSMTFPGNTIPKPLRAQTMPAEDRMPQYKRLSSYNPALEDVPAVVELESPSQMPGSHTRTSTPNDLDYRSIGTHKLGSLRITNGSPGPDSGDEASIRRRNRSNSGEETAGRRLFSQARALKTRRSRSSLNQHEEADKEPAVSVVNIHPDDLTPSIEVAELYGDEPPIVTALRIETSYESLRVFNFRHSHSASLQVQIDPNSPTRASEMARAYMSEIDASPFSSDESPPATPQLEPTSKHTALEDHLFDDEPDSVVTPSERMDFMPRRISYYDEHPEFDIISVDRARLSRWSMEVSVHATEKKTSVQHVKADSGYNSNESLSMRSSTKSRSTVGDHSTSFETNRAPTVPDKQPPPTPPKVLPIQDPELEAEERSIVDKFKQEVEEHFSIFTDEEAYSSGMTLSAPGVASFQKENLGPSKPKHSRGKSWTSLLSKSNKTKSHEKPTATPPKNTSQISQNFAVNATPKTVDNTGNRQQLNELPPPPQRAAPPVPPKQSSGDQERPTAFLTTSHSMPIIGQAVSTGLDVSYSSEHARTGSDSSASSVPNKLRKVRPASQPGPSNLPVTVQAYYEIEADRVPAVPQGMMVALEDHLHKYPPLTNSHKGVQRMNSKATLTTILSVGSTEQLGQFDNGSLFSRLDRSSVVIPSNEDIQRSINQPIRPFPIRSETVPVESVPVRKDVGDFAVHNSNRIRDSPSKRPGPPITRSNAQRRSSFQVYETQKREQFSNSLYQRGESENVIVPARDVAEVVHQNGNTAYHGHEDNLETAGRRSFEPSSREIEQNENSRSKSFTGPKDDRDSLPSRRISMDSHTASQFAREKSRAREERRRSLTPRRSFGPEPGADARGDLLSQPARPRSIVEDVPPVPVLPVEQERKSTPVQNATSLQKTKSPPPVTMATQRMNSPMKSKAQSPYPARTQQRLPMPLMGHDPPSHQAYQAPPQQFQAQNQMSTPPVGRPPMWPSRRFSADQGNRPLNPNFGGSLGALPPPRPPFLRQQTSQPAVHVAPRRRSDQNLQYSWQSRQYHQSMTPQDNNRTNSFTGPVNRMSQEHRRPQSMYDTPALIKARSQSNLRGELLIIDRYSGGLPHFEANSPYGPKNGINGIPQRKALPGSKMWGVDFSDVPVLGGQPQKSSMPTFDDDDDYI